ncbi:MAG: phospholipid carrier-dependent glycosyltransferase, partial [Hydrococcus sp. RM1_1_31]|nr:phospholipid carrier-dependent glycosyltransferase [Hydrococcus sp. RM1_1_31]
MTDRDGIQSSGQGDRLYDSQQVFKISLALGIGVSLIYLAFLKPGIWGIDGNDMFWVSYSLVTEGDFSTGKTIGVLGRGGEYYSIRYPLLPILATPFVIVGIVVGSILNIPARYTATLCALVLPILLTALTTSLVALTALRLGSSKQGAYLAAIAYAFGTTALVYSREFFAEPLLALLTTASVYFALGKSDREYIASSLLTGLAITAKPAGIIVGPLIAFYFFCKRYSWYRILLPLLGTGMG